MARLLTLTLVVALLGVTSCTLVPPAQKPAQQLPRPEAPKPEMTRPELPNVDQGVNDAEALVQYAAYLRRLSAADLNREHESMKQHVARAKTDLNRAQLALIYILPGLSLHDDAKALTILDPLVKEATSPAVRNFAMLMSSMVGDNKRLDENVQNLNSKLKEEQKQSAELQQKLDALKSIEKSLSERDRGKAAPKK